MSGVVTVRGEVTVSRLGRVLPHEHVFCDTVREYRGDGLLNDERLAVEELAVLAGEPTTVVDLTLDEIGRDPEALRRVSEATGVQIVMGCGGYRDPYLDRAALDRTSVAELADRLIAEIEYGVGDSGIRPGIIGEIGADRRVVSAVEERVLRAAARAQRRTGLAISTHSARWPVALAQLEILDEEGVDPRRVIVGHSDSVPDPGFQLLLARRGCFVELDAVGTGTPHEQRRIVEHVLDLIAHGHLGQVLLSQDVFLASHLAANGGPGYGHLFDTFFDRLRGAGVGDGELTQITVHNPARALMGDAA
jgi:phosphotriesterase-related protein